MIMIISMHRNTKNFVGKIILKCFVCAFVPNVRFYAKTEEGKVPEADLTWR